MLVSSIHEHLRSNEHLLLGFGDDVRIGSIELNAVLHHQEEILLHGLGRSILTVGKLRLHGRVVHRLLHLLVVFGKVVSRDRSGE